MNITTILKEFFLPLITKLLQLFPKLNPQHPQPSSPGDAFDPELPDLATGDDTVGVDPVEVPAEAAGLAVVHHHVHMDWADLMIGFCLSVALEMASLSAQNRETAFCNLPLAFSSNRIRLCLLLCEPIHKVQVLGDSSSAPEIWHILRRYCSFHGHYHSITSLLQIRYLGHLCNFRLNYYYLQLMKDFGLNLLEG